MPGRLPCLASLLFLLSASFILHPASADDAYPPGFWDPVIQYLDGSDWVLENANRSIRIENASIPGSVWTELLADPLHGYAERDNQWINAEAYWHYSKVWAPNQSMWFDFVSWHTELVLDGVDTVGLILINGIETGRTESQHRRYVFDAPLFDNSQYNRIDIFLYPVGPYVNNASAHYPYPIPAIDPDNVNSNRSFIRKPTSDFGWDFAPHFMSLGLVKSLYFRSFNQAFIQDVVTRQTFAADMSEADRDYWGLDDGDVLLNVTAFLRTPYHNSSGQLTVDIADQTLSMHVAFPATPQGDGDYLHTASLLLPVYAPDLWWPHTHGAQPLYELTLTFNGTETGTEGIHQVTRRIGFRKIVVLRQQTGDSPGLSFQFVVNGLPIFMKGANLTPFDPFHHRADSRAAAVLQSAVDAGMNMLRVWGGGIYQSEFVYSWADAHGLLLWQEASFACQLVPVNDWFLQSVREEVSQQVRRLAHHPSLAILGGNNENEEALTWFQPSQDNRDRYLIDYNNLYVNTVRDAVIREIGLDIEYVSSSPSNGPLSLSPYVQRWGVPGDYTYGDTHFYPDPNTVDFADPATWPRARFVSEFGFPSMASRWTMQTAITQPSDLELNSTWLQWRQRYSLDRWVFDVNEMEISKHFRLPTTANASLYYDDFTFLSQANQALVYSTAFQALRRQQSEQPSFTAGCLFWQLVDIFQAPTYSAIEYGGRWKAVMHAAQRDYARVIVSGYVYPIANGSSAQFGVYMVNDGLLPITGLLTVQVRLWSTGAVMANYSTGFHTAALASSRVFVTTVGELLAGRCSQTECFVHLQSAYSNDSSRLAVVNATAENQVFLCSLKDVELSQPALDVLLEFGGVQYPQPQHRHADTASTLRLRSHSLDMAPLLSDARLLPSPVATNLSVELTISTVSPWTWFDAPVPGRWNRNSLFLIPNVSWTDGRVIFVADAPFDIHDFVASFTIRTVWDTYHRQ